MKYVILTITSLLCLISLHSQEIRFTASAPKVIELGEDFGLVYSINVQPSGFRPPEFNNFDLLGGPATSSSSSVQIINGRVTQNTTISYTYYLRAKSAGTFTIGSAKATVDGKNYNSNEIQIEVVGQARQGNTGNTNQNQTDQAGVAETNNEKLFVRVILDKNKVYQGEQIIATVKLYSQMNISGIENVVFPTFDGFYSQEIEVPQLRQLTRENVNGQIYGTGILKKLILFPQKSGELIIKPMEMDIIVQEVVNVKPRGFWDDFFGQQVREIKKKIKSSQTKITVLPLPSGAPASFNGAVGSFTLKSIIDRKDVNANDAITIKYSISGNGNFNLIDKINPKFPADFEVFDPKTNLNVKASDNGLSGNKTFEYIVIPRYAGSFNIAAPEFSYFDVKSKQYKNASFNSFEIKVTGNADTTKSTGTIVAGLKEDIKFIGQDIRYIKAINGKLKSSKDIFFGSFWFYFSYLTSLLLFILVVIIWRKKIKDNANISKMKNKRANKIAKKRLVQAALFMKQNKENDFYDEILSALWGYLSDKLSIPISALSRQRAIEELKIRNTEDDIISEFNGYIDKVEMSRYASSLGKMDMDTTYTNAVNLIMRLEQNIK